MKTFTCVSNLWREVRTLDQTSTKLQENLVSFAAIFCLLVTVGVGQMWADTDASVTIATYATSKSWSNETRYTSVTIDSYITATASYTSGNTGKYYSASPGTWRFYQNGGGKLVLTAASGYKIKSFKITFTVGSKGTLTYYGTKLTSGTAITDLNNGRIELKVGATSGSTGNVLVSKIDVTYAASAISPIEYTLVTDAATLTAGDVVVLGYGDNKTAGPAWGAFLTANEATISDGVLTSDEALEFTLGGSAEAWTLNNGSNSLRATTNKALSLAASGGTETWTIDIGSSPYVATIENTGFSSSIIYYNTTDPRFKNYTSAQAEIQLYRKEIDCDKFVDVTGGTSSSNATFNSSSPSSVPTCSSTASDRNFTISITTSTGYEVTSSSNITFTKTSGTATASYVSGPSGSYPNYSYTYRFAQDDNGAGKIDITASARTYEITLDREGGTTGSTSVTMTYNSSSHTAITNPTKSGFTFGGYWTGDNGTGTLVIATDGTLQASVTNYTGAGGIWTKDATCTLYAKWTAKTYAEYVFSCAELTLTPHLVTAGTPIFITSTAGGKVRSQDYITISGSGLASGATLSFPELDSKFEVKTSTGAALPAVDVDGTINVNAYIFYTPASGSDDHIDKITGLTVSAGGAKPKTVTLSQDIIGRRLPTDFVIAGKKNGKWYALPSNMESPSHPAPAEIAVDDIDDPSIAYTAASNKYTLHAQTSAKVTAGNGQYIKLAMQGQSNAPLFGQKQDNTGVGKSGTAIVTNDLSEGYWWELRQINTSTITNPQDAKYNIYSANNTKNHLRIKDNAGDPEWGLYDSGVDELRLIPASSIIFTEAEVVEWGKNGIVVEVDAQGIDATSVIAHLGAANSSAITLAQTHTSKGSDSKYDYTVNFGNSIDFSAAASNGAMLQLEWKKDATTKAMTNIIVPKIIAATTTMSTIESGDTEWEKWEVHVLPGVTLTANAGDFTSNDVTIKHLEIYPGATVNVTKGAAASGTLTTTTLVLRNGWTTTMSSNTKSYDVARLHVATTATLKHTNAYLDWYIDYDQYYPIGVPWPVATSTISYRNTSSAASAGVKIRYYDGSQRASSGTLGNSWIEYTWGGTMPTNLAPSTGYALAAKRPKGKAFSIVRMPLTFADTWTTSGEQGVVTTTHKDQVSVSQNSGSLDWYTQGWNFVANPYMANFSGNVDGVKNSLVDQQGKGIKYATIPDTDFQNFEQVNITSSTLKPSSGFFVQVASTTTLTFSNSGIIAPSAPARYTNEPEAIPDQEADILLSSESGAKDQMGLIIGSDYTADYEINADLAKIIGGGDALKTYMQYGGTDMAYVAINEVLAREWIPVTVYIPVEGEYTYSLMNSSMVDALEGVYLIDYEADGKVTNLLYDTYTFTAEAGTFDKRFAINAIVGDHKVPTSADIAGLDKNATGPIKFIWHDRVYILHNGVIYDSTGKRVNVINK